MMKQFAPILLLCVGLTALGLGGGWLAAKQSSSGGAEGGHGHGGEKPGKEAGHEGHDHGAAKPGLSPQALRNLGITLAEVQTTTFVRTQSVPALVADGPMTVRPLYAPMTGRVTEVRFRPGDLVPAGQAVAVLELDRTIEVRAPQLDGIADWDLDSVEVKPGQKVDAGQVLAVLRNPRRLLLRSEPVGGEIAGILGALDRDADMSAVPLVEGAGPVLQGLKLRYITSDAEGHGEVAFLDTENEPLHLGNEPHHLGGGARTRTWKLRPGQRYMLRVPAEVMEEVFVLPSAAVTDDGPDKVVFLQDGESFKTTKVVVRYQDDEVAVLDAKHSELFPGDSVVQRGAFGLNLALKAGSGAVDPHAGHNH